jgi:hypothetical protein
MNLEMNMTDLFFLKRDRNDKTISAKPNRKEPNPDAPGSHDS